jgi:hypothetical protein
LENAITLEWFATKQISLMDLEEQSTNIKIILQMDYLIKELLVEKEDVFINKAVFSWQNF